jgi:cell division protein FtsL
MPNAQMWGQTGMFMNNVIGVANAIAHSEEEFTQSYKREIARGYATSLATQLSERPALLVQTRSSKIVSKVPKAALWLLVTANLVFAIIAISLTALAISVISSDVHQLRLRMSIAGLTAQLFEGEHAERKVKEEEGLFEEHQSGVSDVKRVGVSRTTKGGVKFHVITR